jgi:hypothetical protein
VPWALKHAFEAVAGKNYGLTEIRIKIMTEMTRVKKYYSQWWDERAPKSGDENFVGDFRAYVREASKP